MSCNNFWSQNKLLYFMKLWHFMMSNVEQVEKWDMPNSEIIPKTEIQDITVCPEYQERRRRRLVERFCTDSSQSPPKRKRDLFEGHKRPENKLRNQFLDLLYIPDDFNIYIYQSDTKKSPSLRERKKLRPKTTL
ncbi:hypothetical protein TNCV_1863831 [Trichonephila clavipes]|nr:hypothetical protein TNCV_1863831 [Trichonephila clavipes]